MKICVCIDKKNGIMLFGKRQSQDRVQRDEMLCLVGVNKLWVSSYSSSLFEPAANVIVDDDFPKKALDEDYCFIEDVHVDLERCSEVVLYHWNRHYPGDTFFNHNLKALGFKRVGKRDFGGSSHDKITEEIYKKVN